MLRSVSIEGSLEGYCRPMINKHLPFKGFNIRIHVIIPIKGGGLLIWGLYYSGPPIPATEP